MPAHGPAHREKSDGQECERFGFGQDHRRGCRRDEDLFVAVVGDGTQRAVAIGILEKRLVCSGEITRADALQELDRPTYSPAMQEDDREYVIKKLGLTEDEFETIMHASPRSFWDYPSYAKTMKKPLPRLAYNSALQAAKLYRSFRAR